MGWKNVKTHYRIEHIVRVSEEGLCIGSPYIPNILVISQNGELLKRYDGWDEDLTRYQRELEADPQLLRRLIETPDTFGDSTTVYTYEGGEIIEKLCETPGWPNTTHDGELMYDNRFSTDKLKVVQWAKANAKAGVALWREQVVEAEREVQRVKGLLAGDEAALAKLLATYPD